MTNYRSFSILMSMASMLLLLACEKSEIKNTKKSTGYTQIIEFRSECEACPGQDECCCGVWLDDDMSGYAKISLCGTSDGPDACTGSAVGLCSSFSGGGHSFELFPPFFPARKTFCVNEGDSFWIANTHGTLSMDIHITCQGDILDAQILHIIIPAGERWYYSVDNACELTLC